MVLDMINGLNGGSVKLLRYLALIFLVKTMVSVAVCVWRNGSFGVKTKNQDVSHSGMVTYGCEQPCFAISVTITQQRDMGHGLW